MASRRDRCRGLLMGLCAGDRNGGPQRLAMRLAEAASSENPVVSGLRRYISWESPDSSAGAWAARLEALTGPEPEASFDTGSIFELVIPKVRQWVQRCLDDGRPIADAELLACADREAAEAFRLRGSAGVSPAHRNAIYAAVSRLSAQELAEMCAAETRLTHHHPEAVATSVATALLCRSLIEGVSLQQSAQAALPLVPTDAPETLRVVQAASEGAFAPAPSHKDGYSPLVLETALHFLASHRTFGSALLQSIQFAGPANYCPVLVGALGGALHGYGNCGSSGEEVSGVTETLLMHEQCDEAHRCRVQVVADVLAREWH